MTGPALGYVLALIAAALAWGVAARSRYHRPVAIGLSAQALADLARDGLAAFYFAGRAGPFTGMTRVLFHVDEALYLVGPVALAWMAVQVFLGAGGGHVLGAALAAWVGLCVGYPEIWRGHALALAYVGAHLLAHIALLLAALAWYLRWPGRWMSASGYILMLLAAGDAVVVVGPYAGDPFGSWSSSWLALFAVHLTAILMQLAMLLARSPGERPARPRS